MKILTTFVLPGSPGLPGRIAIARKHPDARRAADVVGVVTPAALAHLLESDEELLKRIRDRRSATWPRAERL